jgi:hypothetical protein
VVADAVKLPPTDPNVPPAPALGEEKLTTTPPTAAPFVVTSTLSGDAYATWGTSGLLIGAVCAKGLIAVTVVT